MTVASPEVGLQRLARTPRGVPQPGADGGDRIFLTLLSLNFMLLAFFVVLGTAASFDQPKATSVARNVRVVFATPESVENGASAVRLTARQALQASVSDAFADLLPATRHNTADNGDRVDVSVPDDVITASGEQELDDLLDGIAALMHAAPAGVHYQLVLEGDERVAAYAAALLARGVAPSQLMTGTDGTQDQAVRFSFLLLEGDDEPLFARLIPGEAP